MNYILSFYNEWNLYKRRRKINEKYSFERIESKLLLIFFCNRRIESNSSLFFVQCTMNFVINGVFFELCSFELLLSCRSYVCIVTSFYRFSHFPFEFTHLITSKLNFPLKSSVPRSQTPQSSVLCSCPRRNKPNDALPNVIPGKQRILLLSRASSRSKLGIVNRVFMSFLRGCCEALRG